jgi:uncharacterized protein YnzC (UPF0291/DUF896 family)
MADFKYGIFDSIVRTFLNATMYPLPAQQWKCFSSKKEKLWEKYRQPYSWKLMMSQVKHNLKQISIVTRLAVDIHPEKKIYKPSLR